MFNLFNLLADSSSSASSSSTTSSSSAQLGGGWTTYIFLGIFVVFLVGYFIFSQRRNKKQQEENDKKLKALVPGTKIKTIGMLVGTIVTVDGDYFTIKTGLEETPSYITIEKRAIYEIMTEEEQEQAELPESVDLTEEKIEEKVEENAEEVKEENKQE